MSKWPRLYWGAAELTARQTQRSATAAGQAQQRKLPWLIGKTGNFRRILSVSFPYVIRRSFVGTRGAMGAD